MNDWPGFVVGCGMNDRPRLIARFGVNHWPLLIDRIADDSQGIPSGALGIGGAHRFADQLHDLQIEGGNDQRGLCIQSHAQLLQRRCARFWLRRRNVRFPRKNAGKADAAVLTGHSTHCSGCDGC